MGEGPDVGLPSEGNRGDLHPRPREMQDVLVSYRTGMKQQGLVDALRKPEGN